MRSAGKYEAMVRKLFESFVNTDILLKVLKFFNRIEACLLQFRSILPSYNKPVEDVSEDMTKEKNADGVLVIPYGLTRYSI